MILAHVVKGLISFGNFTSWGLVPIHLVAKFSSSLFFLVFGISLALFFVPYTSHPIWNLKRRKLWLRAIQILIVYKILTVIQMFQLYPTERIIDAMYFRHFPDFVEVLSFYGFCLIWIPFFLPFWGRSGNVIKFILIVSLAGWGYLLNLHWQVNPLENMTSWIVRNILVETKGQFTYGQFQRGAIVFLGLWIGELIRRNPKKSLRVPVVLTILSVGFFRLFFWLATNDLSYHYQTIAKNMGKHPPTAIFISFSLGGALALLAFCFCLPSKLVRLFFPIIQIGKTPLFSFSFHIVVLFVILRYWLDLLNNVTYVEALSLAVAVLLATSICSKIWKRHKKY